MISKKLTLLRDSLKENLVDAIIIHDADPHLSEYVSEHWKCRRWISGFSGSMGTVVVTQTKALLWTDSRYFIQAEKELSGTEFMIQKTGNEGTLSIPEWLCLNLPEKSTVSINFQTISSKEGQEFSNTLAKKKISLENKNYIVDSIWRDRPPIKTHPIFLFEEKFHGETFFSKINKIRDVMFANKTDVLICSSLDDIAWTLNLRGSDILFNPVFFSFLVIEKDSCSLFVDKTQLDENVIKYLKDNLVCVNDYQRFSEYIASIEHKQIWIDTKKTSFEILQALPNSATVFVGDSPISLLKSIKNDTEIHNLKNALKKDSIALIKLCVWIEEALEKGVAFSELSVVEKLADLKKELPLFISESFDTIVGFSENGAIVHYKPTEETVKTITENNFLLLDCGSQYLDGTTDITRTIPIGKVSDIQKRDFTLVLKGHIKLASAKFLKGTVCRQIDILAKQALWNYGLTYFHGTGHGIGFFLNVHEPPVSINPASDVELKPGMIFSNEPGIYNVDEFGIRIENIVLVKENINTKFGQFLSLETLTLFPIDINAIDTSLLDKSEIDWLNTYHNNVLNELKNVLNEKELQWLINKTKNIKS